MELILRRIGRKEELGYVIFELFFDVRGEKAAFYNVFASYLMSGGILLFLVKNIK